MICKNSHVPGSQSAARQSSSRRAPFLSHSRARSAAQRFAWLTPHRTRRWPADGLFERINDRIKRQIEKVEEMTGDMDPKTSFALIVIQTELERYRYLVRSYLRARIAKIDRSANAGMLFEPGRESGPRRCF